MSDRLIESIEISGLYGQFDYRMPLEGIFSDTAILYGDNGIGKSTILRLVFNLLSPANNRGHRTSLLNVKFQELNVRMNSGVSVIAKRKKEKEDGSILFEIRNKENIVTAEWLFSGNNLGKYRNIIGLDSEYIQVSEDGTYQIIASKFKKTGRRPNDNRVRGEEGYLAELSKHVPTMFYVSADRRLDSDSVSDPSDEVELRRLIRTEETRRVSDLLARSREIGLAQALTTASRWIQRKAVFSASQGSTNVHSVYVNVVRHLVGDIPNVKPIPLETADVVTLRNRIDQLASKTQELSRYELETPLDVKEFKRSLSGGMGTRRQLAAGVLSPYVESLEGRIRALEPLYEITHKFVTIINNFLNGKSLSYKLSQGFSISNQDGSKLEPHSLSSGEQQLILMFCYVLTARDHPSIFMIDEPEISLNVKWQRQLLQSLIEIAHGAKIQFIFASHSMELIAQHRPRVIKLG